MSLMIDEKTNASSSSETPEQEVVPTFKVKTLLEWQAPAWIFKKRGKDYWTTILAIAGLISIILVFVGEYALIFAIFALIFLYYVLSSNPPTEVNYQVTNRGIRWGEKKYSWGVLNFFWIEKENEEKILKINTKLNLPGQLIIPLGEKDQEEVQEVLEDFLPYHKPEPDFVEKATGWLVKTFPIESNPEED